MQYNPRTALQLEFVEQVAPFPWRAAIKIKFFKFKNFSVNENILWLNNFFTACGAIPIVSAWTITYALNARQWDEIIAFTRARTSNIVSLFGCLNKIPRFKALVWDN